MNSVITVGNKKIGVGQPVFVIAEAGINHGGDLETAKKLVSAASQCGADAVKFQTYSTEKRAPKDSPIFGILKKCELSESDHVELIEFSEKKGILFSQRRNDRQGEKPHAGAFCKTILFVAILASFARTFLDLNS